jgi:hypothetical protein
MLQNYSVHIQGKGYFSSIKITYFEQAMVVHIYNIKLLRKLRLWYEANKSKSARPYLKNKLKRKAVELFAKQAQGQIQFLV